MGNKIKIWGGLYFLCGPVLAAVFALSAEDPNWIELKNDVEARRVRLNMLIQQGEISGIATDAASVSELVIRLFQNYAEYDRNHSQVLKENFQLFSYSDELPDQLVSRLPTNELRACLEVADHAIERLEQQLDGTIRLTESHVFANSIPALTNGYYYQNGQIVFPSTLIWLPDDEALWTAFGRIGDTYYSLNYLQENLTVNSRFKNNRMDAVEAETAADLSPQVLFLGHIPAAWMTNSYPEVTEGARYYTGYDIDSPRVRNWLQMFMEGFMPEVCRPGGYPQIHLLANEPHFATKV
ncbi:MAG: hypothetical protein AB7E95_09250, partial [Kiritimatiellales bacterium]